MQGTTTTTSSPYADDLFCPECGYSLRGLTSERCPECGLKLDFIESDQPLIPWERRREIGRMRAYWQTVFQVVFRNKVFCRAAYRSVSYRDAQLFRWVSMVRTLIALPLILWIPGVEPLSELVEETGWWFVVFALACFVPALTVVTGMPSYFFHPRYLPTERQDRAVALSYYGCAPLGFAVPLGLLLCAVLSPVVFPGRRSDGELLAFGLLGGASAAVVILLTCWLCYSRLARHTLHRAGRRLSVTWIMPLLSVLLGSLVLLGLPAVAYFIALVFYSLRTGGLSG